MPLDDFIERIELLVNDESRIVTYKVLSQELKIPVNKAKWCLMKYLNSHKEQGVNFEVNYFLAGFSEMNGLRSVKVLVVSEDNVEKAKESFTELTSCHIYSIYKGVSKDECALYSADFAYTKDKEHSKYSAIRHPNIEIQPPVLNKNPSSGSDVKMNDSKKETQTAVNGNIASLCFKNDIKSKTTEVISPEMCDNPNANTGKKLKINSPDTKNPKSGNLMNLWQKKEQSNCMVKGSSKAEVKVKEAVKSIPKNSILNMFSKQAAKNAEKPPVLKPVVKEASPKKSIPEVASNENFPKNVLKNNSKKASQKRKVTNRQSELSKTKNNSDTESEFQQSRTKKHRRICTFDDSSESEPEEEKERAHRSFFISEEPIDTVEATTMSHDSEESIPPTPPVIHVKGKAKIWKMVQKTYEDEDGFMVTQTDKELVSASEDEEGPLKDSITKKLETVEKKNLITNKKQASLISFFNKSKQN